MYKEENILSIKKQYVNQSIVLNKHSALIHMINNRSKLLDRKIINYLLKIVQKDRSSTEIYSTTAYEVRKFIGWKNNTAGVALALNKLSDKIFKYNVLRKDKKNQWVEYSLFNEFRWKGEKLYFSFRPVILEAILSPNVYAKLDIAKVNNFTRHGSAVLYELLMDMICTDNNVSRSSVRHIEIEKLKELCGVSHYTYSNFKQRYLLPAIQELELRCPELSLDWEAVMCKNWVESVSFKVQIKQKYLIDREHTYISNKILDSLQGLDEKIKSNFKKVLRLNKHIKGNETNTIELLHKSIFLYLDGQINNPIGYFKKNFEPQLT